MKIRLPLLTFRYGPRARLCKLIAAGFLVFALPFGQRAEAEPVEVVAFGDSITQGYGLNPGEGLVDQLRGWLFAQGAEVRVVNAGVSGDTTAGGRERLDWSLTGGTDAVILELGGNDMLRGLPPAQARENLSAMLDDLKAREVPVLLVGLRRRAITDPPTRPSSMRSGPNWRRATIRSCWRTSMRRSWPTRRRNARRWG